VNGYNGMMPLVRDWNDTLIHTTLDHLDQIKGFMPPFVGTYAEKQALADYLKTLTRFGADTAEVVPTTDSLEGEER
jgi:hypothetical protein